MNSKRLTCYTEVRAEITSYIEARVGIRMKSPASNVRDPNAMDVGQLQQQLASLKGGKGKGKENRDYSHVQCYDYGEYGRIGRQCPHKKGKGQRRPKGGPPRGVGF